MTLARSEKVFSVAKQVRYNTDIGQCPISMACSALSLAKQNISTFTFKAWPPEEHVLLFDTLQYQVQYISEWLFAFGTSNG